MTNEINRPCEYVLPFYLLGRFFLPSLTVVLKLTLSEFL
eukprot:CAMPEP_0201269052 /NCGR_PEP_ID=MMETSP0853-20130426/31274_1 /ASSEMBLY_ACC=CAM_ASM_000640 /TAXON_ID=183588 /ORGANISM="Pseudo-nitzschia fraudulenta, Strain WWA7" /LENGTH=38 /DNA_ID= /DNA_START= /DNA_END= /DNA_ORIENTATION=